MTRVTEVIRGWLGLCPHGPTHKTRTFPNPGDTCQVPDKPSPHPAAPPVTATADSRPAYQENFLLILLLLAGLFCLVDLKMLAIAGVFSALLVYYDAQTLHAGEKFEKESILGDVVTWRPLTWALAVLIIPLIFLAIYVFSRKEIFDANSG
ncbi:hypothetical protein [Methanoregula formicica]|uniref:Uncharacterized protein n=1 Tax=Methanoregula formicica (strain DSM 22288 / NBRC 105244 / SMSP) TaxID=593750 RepID=L0HA49_METFS|nr:hypothetical protein [Methanoregula formicica]AGB01622.1 hypothetical protein Metfor_0559 [Methanoregula formicica SMSP]